MKRELYVIGIISAIFVACITAFSPYQDHKKRWTLTATTNASGVATFNYPVSYGSVPYVNPTMISTDPKETMRLATSTTSGCTIVVELRTDVLGLLPSYAGVNARSVDILIIEK